MKFKKMLFTKNKKFIKIPGWWDELAQIWRLIVRIINLLTHKYRVFHLVIREDSNTQQKKSNVLNGSMNAEPLIWNH